jgi:phage anti-repressor protein
MINNLSVVANEMLPVYENEFGEKFVNARELHEQLLVGKVFAAWIKERIDNYGFIENEDFFPILEKTSGRPKTEYWLTLDTAKEIAMVQNNEVGRAVRKYFIQVEKQSKQQPKTQAEMMLLYAQQAVETERKMKQIEQKMDVFQHRLNNLDTVNVEGDLRDRLNKMIQRLAWQEGIQFGEAWRLFRNAYNTAFSANLKLRMSHYQASKGYKKLTVPQYLDETGQIEDAIRVADKLLNQRGESA